MTERRKKQSEEWTHFTLLFNYIITANKYRFCISVIGYINVQIIVIVIKNQYRSITNHHGINHLSFKRFNTCSIRNYCFTNLVLCLSSNCHQRSLFYYIDSHTTHTVTHHPGLHFPCSIALIGFTCTQLHTHTILHPLRSFSNCRSIVSFIAVFA